MRNATKTAILAVCALAAVLAMAVAAYAGVATFQGSLSVTPLTGHYGDELTISPSMTKIGYPGDSVDLQYLASDNTWVKYGESLSVEETTQPDAATGKTVIGPLSFIVDESLQYPAVVRAVFTAKKSAEGTCASDPVWVRVDRNPSTRVSISAPASVTRGKSQVVTGTVEPVSGVGTVRVTIKRGGVTVKTLDVLTDDAGIAVFSFKQSVKGRYSISEKFLGNQFGAASGTSSKTIVVK